MFSLASKWTRLLNYLAADEVAWSRIGSSAEYAEKIDYMATVRARRGERSASGWSTQRAGLPGHRAASLPLRE